MNVATIRTPVARRGLGLLLGLALAGAGPALAQQYNEAPALAAMVEAGELPPVEERLPAEPLVQEVVEEIGTYGGTLRRGFLGPSDHNNYTRVVYDALVRHSPDGTEVIPHIAKGWESSDDFTQWTVFLREGMKWSDGAPFTADDILFWYEKIVLNEDLSPNVPVWMQNDDGSAATVEKLDDTTVRWTFAEPNTTFLLNLANMDGADRSITNLAFVPAHYMEQFHPDFVDEAELQAKVAERGFQTWVELFAVEAVPHMSGHRPSTAAWVPDGTTVADEVFVIKRNPYYFAVDPEGNQLPYIDEVRFTFFADPQSLNLAAIGGEIDLQGRHIIMSNYPVLVENAEKSGYRVLTYPTFGGSDAVLMLNQTYVNDPGDRRAPAEPGFPHRPVACDRPRGDQGAGLPRHRRGPPAGAGTPPPLLSGRRGRLQVHRARRRQGQPAARRHRPHRAGRPGLPAAAERRAARSRDQRRAGVRQLARHRPAGRRGLGRRRRPRPYRAARAHAAFRHARFRRSDDRDLERGHRRLPVQRPAQVRRAQQPEPHAGAAEPAMDQHRRRARACRRRPSCSGSWTSSTRPRLSAPERQVELAHELFRIWTDNVWEIGTVGLTPMVQGVIVANADLRNVPETAGNDWPLRTPGNTRLEQYFFAQ